MSMVVQLFANKQFDSSLEPLIKGLRECFGFSTKASFIFLASYGLKFSDRISGTITKTFDTRGPEWRDDTNLELQPAINVLLERQGKIFGYNFQEVRTDSAALKKCIDELMKIANATGDMMLNSELSSYKKGVASAAKQDFIVIVSGYLKELAEVSEPF